MSEPSLFEQDGRWVVAWNDIVKQSHVELEQTWDKHNGRDGYTVISVFDTYQEASAMAFELFQESRAH